MQTQTRTQARHALLARFQAATSALETMPPEDREALEAWEREHLDGARIGTMDWPGWTRYLPPLEISTFVPTPERRTPKATIPSDLRWRVWERDNFTCCHCGARRYLTVDHIIPEVMGGELTMENCQTLCQSCNSRKGARV